MILGAVSAGILSKTMIPGIGHVASATMMHDILFAFIPLWKFNMPSSDAFALQQSGLNEFLFAPVGTETNGMTLSLVSVFARLGNDPWLEAGRLAGLPKSEATESLARSIASMPTSIWPLHAAMGIAARLIALLPTQSGKSRRSASANGAKAAPLLRIAIVLVCVACVVAFTQGVFKTSDTPTPDGNSVASLAVSHR
jgi:hypothetical protein